LARRRVFAVGGAQTAVFRVKAKAVEYVRICSLYGAGFFYIPGTDTCIKLGGYLRADLTVNGQIYSGPFWNGEPRPLCELLRGSFAFGATIATRSATEYGVVRTFAQANFQFSTFGSTSSIGLAASVIPGATQVNNDTSRNGYTAVEMVFLQFAGFTFGKSASTFSSPTPPLPASRGLPIATRVSRSPKSAS
jgi:Porin subfamily